jgi:hypothetical protein
LWQSDTVLVIKGVAVSNCSFQTGKRFSALNQKIFRAQLCTSLPLIFIKIVYHGNKDTVISSLLGEPKPTHPLPVKL